MCLLWFGFFSLLEKVQFCCLIETNNYENIAYLKISLNHCLYYHSNLSLISDGIRCNLCQRIPLMFITSR